MMEEAGIAVEAIGALWLISGEINEKNDRAKKMQRLAGVIGPLRAQRRQLRESREQIKRLNEQFGHDAYSVEHETAKIQATIRELEDELEKLDDPTEAILDALPNPYQLKGFICLFLGFLLQLLPRAVEWLRTSTPAS